MLIEDCCDALGSTLDGPRVGTFGAASTYSFYPAHHMTTGEGGAVEPRSHLGQAVASLREWGRDCWCPTGVDDACGAASTARFGPSPRLRPQVRLLPRRLQPQGHRHAGGDRPRPGSTACRTSRSAGARNFARCSRAVAAPGGSSGPPARAAGRRPVVVRVPVHAAVGGAAARRELQRYLLEQQIDSRLLLAGNMTRQPGFQGLEHRIAGRLTGSDRATEASLWVGCHPQLSAPMINWIAECVTNWCQRR